MSDRINGFVVTLEEDIRTEDAEMVMQTIRYMRGVADVQPNIANTSDWINQQRIKGEIRNKMYQFITNNL